MKGLLLKDFYSLKLNMRQYLFLAVFCAVFGIAMDMPGYMTVMSLVLGINLGFLGYAMDEAGGYVYLLSCPVGRKSIVQERYLFVVLCSACMFFYSAAGELLSRLFHRSGTEMWSMQILMVLGFYFILMSVLIPVGYRYGVEKARNILMIMFVLPAVAVILTARFMHIENIVGIARSFAVAGPVLFFGFSLLVLGGSYRISRRIIENTEF